MEIEYQNTKQDYISFYRQGYATTQWQLSLFISSIGFLLVMISDWGNSGFWQVIAYTCLGVAAVYLFPYLYVSLKTNRLWGNFPSLFKPKTLIITDEAFISRTDRTDTMLNWGSILYLNVTKKFATIKFLDGQMILVPLRAFQSDNDAVNFFGEFRSKLVSDGKERKPRPPYALGLLSAIPFAGAVTGVALIILGVFKYKDIWLVILGALGVGFTIIIYTIYSGMPTAYDLNSKQAKSAFAQEAQYQLNSLVKEIEFYKLENGVYPDSLQQLGLKDSFTNIDDPLLSGKKNDTYNYHRIGNKYTLFSSGPDQIPNTADDIYPSIKIDTSKIGLIIRKK
jgi:hypothetical protein